MIIFTGGHYIKCEKKPNDVLNRFYVNGYRWIKSKKKWADTPVSASFLGYEVLTDEEAKSQGLLE